eukprot:SAG11_NODE_9945_length_867_cov_1.204427_1_plen_134_part_00
MGVEAVLDEDAAEDALALLGDTATVGLQNVALSLEVGGGIIKLELSGSPDTGTALCDEETGKGNVLTCKIAEAAEAITVTISLELQVRRRFRPTRRATVWLSGLTRLGPQTANCRSLRAWSPSGWRSRPTRSS